MELVAGCKRRLSHVQDAFDRQTTKRQHTSPDRQPHKPAQQPRRSYVPGAAHNISHAAWKKFYAGNHFKNPNRHGHMAEHANHFQDRKAGVYCKHVGGSNGKNGPDRLVGPTHIQTKFLKTPEKTLAAFFKKGEPTKLRYLDVTGAGFMDMEVPADQYDTIVAAWKRKLAANRVQGITDSEGAHCKIRKSQYTYQEAKDLCKAGTITGLKYDVETGAISGLVAGGMAFAVSMASGNFKDGQWKQTTAAATCNAGSSTARAISTHVGACQLSRCVGASKCLDRAIPRATLTINATVAIAQNTHQLYKGDISKVQAEKNMCKTAAGLVGGYGGALAGAAAGSCFCPGIGSVVGAMIGGTVAGIATELAARELTKLLLGLDDPEFVSKIYDLALAYLREQHSMSEGQMIKARAALETPTMYRMLIADRNAACLVACKQGQTIIDSWGIRAAR